MKFSIITCTKDSAPYLEKNIRSVESQSYTDYEHIFIDGFSVDRSPEIIAAYKKRLPNKVQVFRSAPRGISAAMNEGIRKARGEFIIHLHSDDSFYDSNVLRDVADFLQQNQDLDWIYGQADVVEEDGRSIGIFPDRRLFQNSSSKFAGTFLLKFFRFIPHQAVFIRRSVFDRFGYFDESLASKMDTEMWLRIGKRTKWAFYNRIVCNYTVRPGAQSSGQKNQAQNLQNLREVQKKHLSLTERILARAFKYFLQKRNRTLR